MFTDTRIFNTIRLIEEVANNHERFSAVKGFGCSGKLPKVIPGRESFADP